MSKVVRAVVGVTLFVAGVFMGGTTWPLAVMALGGGIAASALQPQVSMPSVSSATSGRLSKSLEPECFRKIAFGRTALGTDTRYWEAYGADQSNYDEVIALAGHTITSFDALYVEDELVTFDGSGNATGAYAGALSIKTELVGTSGSTLSGVGAGSKWATSGGESASMTGVAYMVLKWVWSQEKLPRGFPTRITPVGKGVRLYDPRLDSTRGGSGSHRVDDQSTWEHLPLDSNGEPIGRNAALQILHYLIGWYVQNPSTLEWVLVHGMGVDPEDIDFASFITAANECEAEGYYADCLLSTGDNHATNLGILEQACAGKVSDAGGLYTLRIQVDDFDGTLTEFTDDDVVGECDWRPEMPLAQSGYNQIAGQFIDPDALYQLRALPLMRDASYEAADGEKARTNVRLDAVQDPDQGQKLLRIRLNKSRQKGLFEAPFGWRAVNVRVGQPVQATFSRFGFDGRYFRVRAKKTDPGGAVWLALETDHPTVYTGGTVATVAAPATGTGYDPTAVATPTSDEWEGTGGSVTVTGGAEVPAVMIDAGATAHPSGITGILAYTSQASNSGPWNFKGEYPPGTESFILEGLLANETYYVRLAYRNAFGVIDPSSSGLVLGPFTTGDAVATDATAPSSAISEAVDAINTAQGRADTTLAEAGQALAEAAETSLQDSLLNWIEDPTGSDGWQAADGGFIIGKTSGFKALWTPLSSGAQTTKVLWFPNTKNVAPGVLVQAGVDVAVEGAITSAALEAVWFDSAGSLLSVDTIDSGASGRLSGVEVAPASAGSVRFRLVPTASSAADGSLSMSQPLSAFARPGQVAADDYQDPSSEVVSRFVSIERSLGSMAGSVRQALTESRRARAVITSTMATQLGQDTALAALSTSLLTTVAGLYATQGYVDTTFFTESQVNASIAGYSFVVNATTDTISGHAVTTAGAVADVETGAAYWETLVEASGGNPALVGLYAGKDGSLVTLAGDALYFYTTVGGVSIKAMEVVSGDVRISNDLYVDNALIMAAGGAIRGGASGYLAGTGFFLGYDTSAYKLAVGDPAGQYLAWDGATLAITGDITRSFGASGALSIGDLGGGRTGFEILNASGVEAFYADDTGALRLNGDAIPTTRAGTAPSTPRPGEWWFDTSDDTQYRWNGSTWDGWGTIGGTWGDNIAGRPANLAALTGSEGINNAGIYIGANGALTGAGGGQVTISGLGYSGDLNATYGAAWGSTVTGRPTELTDGRVAAGLDAAGDLNRNISSSRATSSNLLRRTGGGLFSGDLAATAGATWGADVASRPANLAALVGTEGINNAAISIGADGSLAGAGGGQVTISGLGYTGALNANYITNTNELTDGAGLGNTAVWSSVSSRPTELTDGRVATALNASGVLQTSIPLAAQIPSLPASQIGSGTFDNARIAASNVTQHQAALTIGNGQVTGLGGLAVKSTIDSASLLNSGVVETSKLAANAVTNAASGDGTIVYATETAIVTEVEMGRATIEGLESGAPVLIDVNADFSEPLGAAYFALKSSGGATTNRDIKIRIVRDPDGTPVELVSTLLKGNQSTTQTAYTFTGYVRKIVDDAHGGGDVVYAVIMSGFNPGTSDANSFTLQCNSILTELVLLETKR